ncbi:MAG: hypothetical protein HRT41_08930 [Campylobacteraceae bacterium]|nr:hypothetical protein [Campylobacteraceae bacterium]
MHLLSNKPVKIFFLEKNTTKIIPNEKMSLILSPEFYWTRFFELPVKSVAAAIEILPDLFEEFLPFNNYSYQAIKLADRKFLCFAYNNDEIYNMIKKLKFPISLIKNIYFAQNEFKDYESFSLNETSYMYINTILVKVPKNVNVKEIPVLDNNLQGLKLSKTKVALKLYKSLIDKKYLYLLLTFLFFLSSLNVLKILIYKTEINKNKNEMQNIKKRYHLPSTMLQTKSIIKNYDKKIEENIKIRAQIKHLVFYKKIEKNIIFKKIKIEDDSLIVYVNTTNSNKFKKYIEKKYSIKKAYFFKNTLRIELFI